MMVIMDYIWLEGLVSYLISFGQSTGNRMPGWFPIAVLLAIFLFLALCLELFIPLSQFGLFLDYLASILLAIGIIGFIFTLGLLLAIWVISV